MAPAQRNRAGVPQAVVALEAAEVLARGPSGKAIAWVSRDPQPLAALWPLALLPFVIPTPPQTYALLTLAGTAWLLLVVELHRARERRRGGQEGNS
jgi:hypothetical protein